MCLYVSVLGCEIYIKLMLEMQLKSRCYHANFSPSGLLPLALIVTIIFHLPRSAGVTAGIRMNCKGRVP